MNQDEIKAALSKKRAGAWYQLRILARASVSELNAAGFRGRTNAEAVLEAFKTWDRELEQQLRAWERANP